MLLLIVLILAGTWMWIENTAPDYEGTLTLNGLQKEVEIDYDTYGVPHIYAANAHDAYFALGYAHAQERLFQMVMIRQATSGRLSEIFGKQFIGNDKLMRTLAIRRSAEKDAQKFFTNTDAPYKKQAMAYLEGINSFIKNGTLPVEFTLIGFKPDEFTPEDIYTSIGYMSLSFTAALSEDPLSDDIYQKPGNQYLTDFGLDSLSNASLYGQKSNGSEILSSLISWGNLRDYLPVPIWEGSNNWVISKEMSASGKVLLANDTHIQYSQPAVWYEAHLNYPGFEMFGYYLAGVPFAIMGHNRQYGWGLTIFPFDNMDLYREKQNPDNPDQYWVNDHWENYRINSQVIRVKDGENIHYNIKSTRHGPVLNDVNKIIKHNESQPVSLWWSLNKMDTKAMKALYEINNAKSMTDFEKGVQKIDLLGLNVVYGDTDDNIAWWATGKIPVHPSNVNSKLILDGASGNDEIQGYYPFDENPKSINPTGGFLGTSNNKPPCVNGILYPGYYAPGYRSARIKRLVGNRTKWDVKSMRHIQLDNLSERDTMLVKLILKTADTAKIIKKNKTASRAIYLLGRWGGTSNTSDIGVTIYNQLLYFILRNAMQDELGDKTFGKVVNSAFVRSGIKNLFLNENSVWWDDVSTPDKKETRQEIFTISLDETLEALNSQLGEDVATWRWEKVHTLTHVHPIGRKKPFDKIFNVGPFAVAGSNEVIDKESFKYTSSGNYPVTMGPAMRLLLDFGDPAHALSIIPTGQSGNIMSRHYADQSKLFINGKYRVQVMDKGELADVRVLKMIPGK